MHPTPAVFMPRQAWVHTMLSITHHQGSDIH
jgi:hypothetical protein